MKHAPRILALLIAGVLVACVAKVGTPPPNYAPPPNDPVVTAPPPNTTPPPPPAPPPPPPPVVVAPPPAPPPPPPPPPVNEHRDDVSDRRFDCSSDWDKLGERWVQGRVDCDTIKVGKKKKRFLAIAVVVEHSALEMFDIVVTFGDGQTFSPPTRLVFAQDTGSRVIDLPGGARVIKKVEFRYGNLPGGGKAQVELWGFDAHDDDHDHHDGDHNNDGHPDNGHGNGHGHGHGNGGGGGGGHGH